MEKEVKTVKFLDRTFNANYEYMMQILDFIVFHLHKVIFRSLLDIF